MSQAEFGDWLVRQINAELPEGQKPLSAYKRQRVHEWENGNIPLPARIELILLRRELEQKDQQIADLQAKQRQRQKPS